jgi:glycosyltransferase involved in cell wall biosynthesis
MKISIITPSLNQEKFIRQTIESVINQKGDFDLEYIIIDGQSTDKTIEIIKEYATKDSRIKWVSEPDKSQSNAINKGLKMASGDIISYLNADDIYYPNTLQIICDSFKKHNRLWLYGKCKIIDVRGGEIRKIITKYKNFFLKKYNYNKLLIINYISQPAVFWKKELMQQIGHFNETEHLAMDYDYWCRAGKKNIPIVINQYLSGFRYHHDNKSNKQYLKQFNDEYRIAALHTSSRTVLLTHKLHIFLIKIIYFFINY